MLLSQDEARFQMVPTLAATLGVKGHRPVVGTRDCKDALYVFAVMNLISGALHANTLESLQAAKRRSGESKNRRMQRAFADHLLKTHGIKTSRSAMQRFCSKIGIRPYRPTYRFLRGDPAKQEAAKEDLAGLKKSAGRRAGAAEPG